MLHTRKCVRKGCGIGAAAVREEGLGRDLVGAVDEQQPLLLGGPLFEAGVGGGEGDASVADLQHHVHLGGGTVGSRGGGAWMEMGGIRKTG